MGVNRFMSPVKTQYMQTAVDQHVPLPFELMQKRAEAEQKHFDDNRANMQALTDRMGEDLLNIDNPAQSNAISDLRGRLDSAIDDYNGDWRKMDDVLRNVANQYNTEVTTGKLALGKSNKIKHDTNYKEIEESNVSDWNKDLQHRWTTAGYGGILEGKEINVLPAGHKNEKTVDRILKSFNETVASSEGKGGVGYRYGDGLIVEWHKDVSGVTRDQYRNNVAGIVATDEDWQGLKKKEFRMLSDLGELPTGIENIDQYKALALEREFMGMAEGKENIQTDYTEKGKESKKAVDEAAFVRNNLAGGVSINRRIANPDQKDKKFNQSLVGADDNEIGSILANKKQEYFDNGFNKIAGYLNLETSDDPSSNYDYISDMVSTDGNKYNLSKPDDRRRLMEGVADGTVDLTKLFGSKLVPDALVKDAQNAVREVNNMNQKEIDVKRQLLESGSNLITKEQFENDMAYAESKKIARHQNKAIMRNNTYSQNERDYAKNHSNLMRLTEERDNIIAKKTQLRNNSSPLTREGQLYTEEMADLDAQIKYLDDSAFTWEKTMRELEATGNISKEQIKLVDDIREQESLIEKNEALDLAVAKGIKNQADYELHNKVNHSFNPLSGSQFKGKTTEDQNLQAASFNKAIANSSEAFASADVVYGNGKKGPLKEAIAYEADQLIEAGDMKEEKKVDYIEKRLSKLKGQLPRVSNALSQNGELIVEVLGKYEVELGTKNGQANIPGLKESLSTSDITNKWVNGQVKTAMNKGGSQYEVADLNGISIRTIKGSNDAETNLSEYNVVIQPYVFDIPVEDAGNIVIPQDKSKLFMRQMKALSLEASVNNGYVKNPRGKSVPLKEAQQGIINSTRR